MLSSENFFETLPKRNGAASSKPSVGPLSRIKMSFFLLSICTSQLKSPITIE